MLRDDGRSEHAQTPCPTEMRTAITRMDGLMSSDPRYNHAGIPAQIALDLIKDGAVTSFSEFETWLREMGSDVHFVAVPLDFYGPSWAHKTVNPFNTTNAPEYTLWTGVNGEAEAAAMLATLEISVEENSQRLLTAGILSVS